ncbi:MAG: PASTA domain-containing protein [Candidatus Omnitrophota bacterium]
MIKKISKAILRLINGFFLIVLFIGLLVAGIAGGGIWLMDYLIRGEEVTVPRLYGLTKSEAVELLVENELIPHLPVKEVVSDNAPPGIVIEQRPYPDTFVKKGRSVAITVSAGPQEILIPDLTDARLEEISGMIRSAGLELGQRAFVYHPTYPKGTVILQDPPYGRRLVIGKKINLLVSLGPQPEEYIMPKLIGVHVDEILNRPEMEPFPLVKENIHYVKTESSQWNIILKQNPEPGAKIVTGETGEPIAIDVGSSGTEIALPRMIHIVFPLPYPSLSGQFYIAVWDETVSVWDETVSVSNRPLLFPLEISPWSEDIDVWIPVSGDAWAGLMEGWDENSLSFAYPLTAQYYPSTNR